MKRFKWTTLLLTTLCVVVFAAGIQSCDEEQPGGTIAPVVETGRSASVTTPETPDNPIAGKSMVLVRAFDAKNNVSYTFDPQNIEDRFLLVPGFKQSGHMLQASEQKVKTAGREFIEEFYHSHPDYDADLNSQGEFVARNGEGDMLVFEEWDGDPLFTESDLVRPEKGTSVASTQIICWTDWECTWSCGAIHGECENMMSPHTCTHHEGPLLGPDSWLYCHRSCRWVVYCSEYLDVLG